MKRWLLFLVALVVFAAPTMAQQPATATPPRSMSEVVSYWKALDYFEQRKTFPPGIVQNERMYLIAQAKRLTGKTMTPEAIATWKTQQRLLSVTNWVQTIAVVLLVIGASSLVIVTLIPLLKQVPPFFWEVLAYGVAVSLMFLPANGWAALGGALLLGAVLPYTFRPKRKADAATITLFKRSYPYRYLRGIAPAAIGVLVYTAAALRQQSPSLGFMAVAALESLLGFTIWLAPLRYGFGFLEREYVAPATFASLLVIVLGAFLHHYAAGAFAMFIPSLLGIGCFVYFIGLLILSSRFYITLSKMSAGLQHKFYWLMQAVTVVSGLAALYLGPALELPFLQSVGGTLFVFYLVGKYIEINWGTFRYSVGALGLGALLYGLALFVRAHPQYFLFRL